MTYAPVDISCCVVSSFSKPTENDGSYNYYLLDTGLSATTLFIPYFTQTCTGTGCECGHTETLTFSPALESYSWITYDHATRIISIELNDGTGSTTTEVTFTVTSTLNDLAVSTLSTYTFTAAIVLACAPTAITVPTVADFTYSIGDAQVITDVTGLWPLTPTDCGYTFTETFTWTGGPTWATYPLGATLGQIAFSTSDSANFGTFAITIMNTVAVDGPGTSDYTFGTTTAEKATFTVTVSDPALVCSSTTLNDVAYLLADDETTTPFTKYVNHAYAGTVTLAVPTVQATVDNASVDCGTILYTITSDESGTAFTDIWVTITSVDATTNSISIDPTAYTSYFTDTTKRSVTVYVKAQL